MKKASHYKLRNATYDDISALNTLIAQSARALSRDFYTNEQIEAAITHIFGVDTELLDDASYYVVLDKKNIVACGGWSRRKTLFGGNQYHAREAGYSDPIKDAAKIRAFFVHPDHARKGLGAMLLDHCENCAKSHGFSRAEMMATLPGIKLYERFGYEITEAVLKLTPDGVEIPGAVMQKTLLKNENE